MSILIVAFLAPYPVSGGGDRHSNELALALVYKIYTFPFHFIYTDLYEF